MATQLYAWQPNTAVLEGVGGAASAYMINLTVDIATTLIIDQGANTRGPDREDVLKALDDIKAHILRGTWPPA